MNIEETNTFKRLCELRIDFAYSKSLFFEAYLRLEKEKQTKKSQTKRIEMLSILFDIMTLSSLSVYFESTYKDASIIAVGILSIMSLFLSIIVISSKDSNNEEEYLYVANQYLGLYKKCKNTEAKCKDGIVNIEGLAVIIDDLVAEQLRLNKKNLSTIKIDYDNAKNSIEKGNASYTDEDLKRT